MSEALLHSRIQQRLRAPAQHGPLQGDAGCRRRATSEPDDPTGIPGWDLSDTDFEAFLAEIAGELMGAPLDGADSAFTRALSRLVAFLRVERAVIALPDPSGTPAVAHCVASAGVPEVPIGLSEADLPWLTRELRAHRGPVFLSSKAEPPSSVDLRTIRRYGMRSTAFLPITAGSRLLGVLSLGTMREERSWPPAVVDRLRLIASMFAGACLRLEYERKLRASQEENEVLRERFRSETEHLHDGSALAEGFDDIVGESAVLRDVLFMAEQVARTNAAVLLLGETGTGKELIAQAIHAKSQRGNRGLVKVNCAALPPTLVESELFGHEKGAFTGAISRKIGRFELADHGTLFLDEVGELPLALQGKLLRVLQEGEFERVGSTVTRKVDVRVIAATNRDLSAATREGSFRNDLYYRLAVFPIQVPPLRARKEDIPMLVWHFLGELGTSLGRKIDRVPAPAMDRLMAYGWPGNIRELRNVLERAIILSPGTTLALDSLAETRQPLETGAGARPPAPLVDVEREHILRVLDLCNWRVRGPRNAAQRLGLNASTLYSRMKKLGIRRAISSTPA